MRRRLIAMLMTIVTMSACTPVPAESRPTPVVLTPTPVVEQISPAATPEAIVTPTPEPPRQWMEVSSELSEEPTVETTETVETAEIEDQPYVEVVAVPDATPTSLGTFVVTAYCDCVKCNGKWTGHKLNTPTQAGVPYPVDGYTISVDPNVIPLGSVVELDGLGARYAQDTGSAIKGKRIDLFLGSHEEALKFGVKKLEVWVYL